MTKEEIEGVREAFSASLDPVINELRAIHETLAEHGQLLRSIDHRLTNVEGTLDGVEILVRKKTG